MNILFLVISFIFIFLFFSSTLLKQTIFFSSEQKSVCSYIDGKRKLANKLERYKYKTYDEKLVQNKPETSTKKKDPMKDEDKYISHRLMENLPSQGRWNLSPFLFSQKQIPLLKEALQVFLESLYGHASFWREAKQNRPDFIESLLDAFSLKSLQKDEIEKVSDLFPEDPFLQQLFYKMLKGSYPYDLKSKKGYPPIEDFFHIDKESSYTLCLPYASYQALTAFVGEASSEKILEIEKEKWKKKGGYYSITKQELFSCTDVSSLSQQEMEILFQFAYKKNRLEKILQKEGNKAFLQIKLP